MKRWILAILTSLIVSASALAAIEVYDFDSPEQESQFQELSNTLRCPKCQNNTIADSNAALAQDLRHKVYEMTKQGQSKQEIIDYMTARYGDFITYNPPFTASTAILWLGPLAVLAIGFSVIVVRSRSKTTTGQGQQWDSAKEARLKALLEEAENGDKHK
ncbi:MULTISPECIES: cytochrome c-type biogenesis protein [Vibrio]|uniref:Cytochrome c-type biogenesis protein n=1 Tax=Vibrio ostreae TaxID=2841925 RepID=A0A975UBT1_9VIBR|nr:MULTISPECIES: cytochrome c-type biogenesis protein [Vibrio]QXO18171.1 cytochrome c-type biogenesis protein CcmH [Vibrio ostreae]WGY47507.1 cytochrome c-type biogenesis protein CcmH [Vibrio sp. ABG19]